MTTPGKLGRGRQTPRTGSHHDTAHIGTLAGWQCLGMPSRRDLSFSVNDHDVPYVELRGDEPGPSILVMAGVHGCEYASIAAVRRLILELSEQPIRGTVTLIPVVNVTAFEQRVPFLVPADGKNLNRCFPGDPAGTDADRLAAAVFDLVRRHEHLLDLHAGDLPEALVPFTIYEESAVEETARAMAMAYGLDYVLRDPLSERSAIAGSSESAASDAGVPAIIAEAGGQGLVAEYAVQLHRDGVLRVLRLLTILPADDSAPPPQAQELAGSVWQYTAAGGWWQPEVGPGDHVVAGQRVGAISDLLGVERAEIRADVDGVLLFLTSAAAVAENGLLLAVGRLR